ncbi:MAG: hypothetical protein MUP82_01160, partial [Candidatus Marinimicrobia bacterium]|nr:hypothetical protein [Candidatus Neomarinimicrobiota bacterium]
MKSLLKSFTLFATIIILLISSCKLFEAKDTTDPVVNLTISGGNEISRGVTLYLDIEDDSKIDFVSIMIDDTTAITVTSNFDTIHFDVTPFADESEHILYAKVADKEGNIGESEKLDVVITEFPGWRIYDNHIFDYGSGVAPIKIDQNGILLIGGWGIGGLYIFNPTTNDWQQYTPNNSPMITTSVVDIRLIEDGRAWIANNNSLIEYVYGLNHW